MKRFIFIILASLSLLTAAAQEKKKFDVAAYRDSQKSYVLSKVEMTAEEAETFFVLYSDMRTKEREMFKEAKRIFRKKPDTDDQCRAAIVSCDSISMAIKSIDAEYHQRMMESIAPTKVYKALQCCDAFDRKRYNDHFVKEDGAKSCGNSSKTSCAPNDSQQGEVTEINQ